jgi:hypothetical protein
MTARIRRFTAAATLAVAALLCFAAPAAADEPVAADITFDVDYRFLPPGVNPGDFVAMAREYHGDHVEGWVLLTDGRKVDFVAMQSRPFQASEAYVPNALAALGK